MPKKPALPEWCYLLDELEREIEDRDKEGAPKEGAT